MATKRTPASPPAQTRPPYMLIEQIQVKGYKSLVDATLHVKPLTLLAGTNSSGKSSIMQPLLLIKQTMEAPYQPAGALVLDGAHVQAETAGELMSKSTKTIKQLIIIVDGKQTNNPSNQLHLQFKYGVVDANFKIESQYSSAGNLEKRELLLMPDSASEEIIGQFSINGKVLPILEDAEARIEDFYGLLGVVFTKPSAKPLPITNTIQLRNSLLNLMHVPGLRGAPKRTYAATFFSEYIKGTFDLYAAGTINQWQQQENKVALIQLNDYLRRLGLTDSVTAKAKNANEVELSVSRLPAGSKPRKKADMVNIADVGIGVSQVLPILVALIAAQEGQIVYVEQPELHLHPRAQVAMAELLTEAANRGVRVIVETHSSLLLLTVQTLIAQEKIKNTDVALHWFARDAKGATQVTYVQPDEDGAYGEWPEDFGDVELKAQDAYLTAVGLRHFGKGAE